MLQGDDAYLLSAMSEYGYSLLQPDRMPDPNDLLAALSQSADVRVLEGFPVVLATALEKRRDAVNLEAAESSLKDAPARERFEKLAALSFYLFGVFGFEELKQRDYSARLDRAKLLDELRDAAEHNRPLAVGSKTVDLGRVKRTFLNYFVHSRNVQDSESKTRLREDFRREYYLSLFFAPKQRDLLQKKLRGEALTKTEREYFSRVVKKKLLALADPDLHRLAQKALQ